jgi:hypothetical protein
MDIVGWRELFHFVELGFVNVHAKIDTGAYGNVMHCDTIEIIEDKLHFTIGKKNFVFEKYKTVSVRSSFGEEHERYTILTSVLLGNKQYKLHVSLNNRDKMKYPMLIGRRFLQKFGYVVDVNQEYININDFFKKV